MGFDRTELSGAPPIPAGWYTAQIKNFKPRAAANKESISFNCELAIIGNPEYEGRRFFVGLNTKMAWMWTDFVHATGMEMEIIQNELTCTEKEQFNLPGVWEGSDQYPDDPSQWKYQGPLLNKTMDVELAEIPAGTDPKSGRAFKAKNEVRQFKCAVTGCTEKHSTNLIKG
jgi:hypothetical protein